jgi:hypothetical protein
LRLKIYLESSERTFEFLARVTWSYNGRTNFTAPSSFGASKFTSNMEQYEVESLGSMALGTGATIERQRRSGGSPFARFAFRSRPWLSGNSMDEARRAERLVNSSGDNRMSVRLSSREVGGATPDSHKEEPRCGKPGYLAGA